MDLSIIVACSRPKCVRNLLQGLENQSSNLRFEVIVVGLVENLLEEDFNLDLRTFLCRESHPNVRRNIGLSKAKSDLVAFLDDDTIPDKDWVSAAIHHSNPEKNIVLVGPERCFDDKKFSDIVYRVSKNILSEGTRAHVNSRSEEVSWTNAPFCNCVIPMKLFVEVGMLAEDIPWDMDDFEFCNRAKEISTFWNVPQLSIRHDRYPDSFWDLAKYKWNLRRRTGEKLVTHPGIYWSVIPVVITAILPIAIIFLAWLVPKFFIILVYSYIGIMVSQIPTAILAAKGSFWLYLQVMFAVHVITIVGVQVGMIRAVSQFFTHRN